MVDKSFGGRLLALLASLRLAVVTMVTLGAICGYATFYEMRHGTPAVQRDIYQTPWFAALLALLGINVFAVMVSRYPWTRHHIGFLTAHVGILAILAGSVVSIHWGLDSNMALYEGETSDRVALHDTAVQVYAPALGAQASFPVAFERQPPSSSREQRFAVPGTGLVLVADAYEPHVSVVESFQPAASGPAAVHFRVQAMSATQDAWLVPDDPERGQLDLGIVSFSARSAADETQARQLLAQPQPPHHLTFVLAPGGSLLYAAADAKGALQSGPVATGQPLRTGWAAAEVIVDRVLPAAALVRQVEPETPPVKEEKRQPAVRLDLEGPAGRSEPQWVVFGEQRQVRIGDQTAGIGYRSPEVGLPFRVTLLRFSNESYPGSRMAATYESTVRVEDPGSGSFETLISMNHPLHYRGYIFFQSSFVEGRPMMSIFSVARAPGLPLVYLGTGLVGLGIVWMFYVKPYLARRQAAAALAVHRARENRNEAKPSDAVPAGPAQPAPRRA